jgi:hypothetical protein
MRRDRGAVSAKNEVVSAKNKVGCFKAMRNANTFVMPGLDPGIHLLPKTFFEAGWIAGSSPATTTCLHSRDPVLAMTEFKLSSPAKAGDPVFQRH